MPRPKKCRRVCHFPGTRLFVPAGETGRRKKGTVVLTVDEYETIRLIDREGFSQEQCGERMDVSRTTVQAVYTSARKKLADALVGGLALRIEGGDYQLCSGEADCPDCCGCFKRQLHRQYTKPRGENSMRIAVTFENGEVFQHFGRTEQFKIYDVEEGKVVSSEVVGTGGQGHGALAGVLGALGVDTLLCGGIGGGAQSALEASGIRFYGGVQGDADRAVEALLAGQLVYNPDVHCDHHGHGEGHHECGSHGCGSHGCRH